MPIIEFNCPFHGTHERIILSREEADKASSAPCPDCGSIAERVMSTCNANFVGDGFYKPSASGSAVSRVDGSKLAKEVYQEMGGHRGVVKKVQEQG